MKNLIALLLYKELQAHPYIQLCVRDQETMTYVRLGGKVNI